MRDLGKDDTHGKYEEMCYNDSNNRNGITKYIKGSRMQSGVQKAGKQSFEVRIHLSERLLRVASLPYYASVAELNDPNKIDPKADYRFFISMR